MKLKKFLSALLQILLALLVFYLVFIVTSAIRLEREISKQEVQSVRTTTQ